MESRLTKAANWSQVAMFVGTLAGGAWGLWKWIDPPKRWPKMAAFEFVGPMLGIVAILLVGFALSAGLRRLTVLERQLTQEQDKRGSDFEAWLGSQSRRADEATRVEIARLTEQLRNDKQEWFLNLDRFYKNYGPRLIDLETRSEEGKWVPIQIGERTFRLTQRAYEEYAPWHGAVREDIHKHLLFYMDVRACLQDIRAGAGDVRKEEDGGRIYIYQEVEAMTPDEREALFDREPSISRWYADQQRKRRDNAGGK